MEIKGTYEFLKTNFSLLPHASSEECKYAIFIDNEWRYTGFGHLGYHFSSSFKVIGNYSTVSVYWNKKLLKKVYIAMQIGNNQPIILKYQNRKNLNPLVQYLNLAPDIDIKRDIVGEVTGRTKIFSIINA